MLMLKLEKRISQLLLCLLSLLALAGCVSKNTLVPLDTPTATLPSSSTSTPLPKNTNTPVPTDTPITGISKSNRFGIVFTTDYTDIYRIPDNTQSKIEQLTYTPTVGEYPLLVSINGEKIIFKVGLTGGPDERQQNVYILDTSSKVTTNITNVFTKYEMVSNHFSVDWSPDQKQFVIVTDDGSGIELMNFDGTNKKDISIPLLGKIPSLIQSAQWSPDGKRFVLTREVIGIDQQEQNPGSAMLVYDLENGNLTQITDYKDGCLPIEWSPTSQQIAAICETVFPYMHETAAPDYLQTAVRIFDINHPGQPYEHIYFSPCDKPSWSPDGKQLTFVCDKDETHKGLFIVDSNGNNIQEVNLGNLGNPAVLGNPLWSPDGTQIIYVAGADYQHTNIYSVHLDGSDNRPMIKQEAFYNLISVYPVP